MQPLYLILFAVMLACPAFAIFVLVLCTIAGVLKLAGAIR